MWELRAGRGPGVVMEGDPGTGQAGVGGDELDTGWLESEVCLWVSGSKSRKQLEMQVLQKEPEGQKSCFCSTYQGWEGATSRSEPGSIALLHS